MNRFWIVKHIMKYFIQRIPLQVKRFEGPYFRIGRRRAARVWGRVRPVIECVGWGVMIGLAANFLINAGGQVLNVEFLRGCHHLRRVRREAKRRPIAAATRPMMQRRWHQTRAIRSPGIAVARPLARCTSKFDAQRPRHRGGRHTGEF